MDFLGLFIIVLSAPSLIYFIFKELRERSILKETLINIIGKTVIEEKDDFIKIKNYLLTNITYNGELKNKRRPLLRSSASDTLKSHYGFCGENARVAIKLLALGGVKAKRIYLFREAWQHVLIEHEYDGKWYMFDGHYDIHTLLKDEQLLTIPSENIALYPNDYPNNPYLDFCRIKLFYLIGPLKSLSKKRIPQFITLLSESPYFIKIIFFAILFILGIVLYILFNQ